MPDAESGVISHSKLSTAFFWPPPTCMVIMALAKLSQKRSLILQVPVALPLPQPEPVMVNQPLLLVPLAVSSPTMLQLLPVIVCRSPALAVEPRLCAKQLVALLTVAVR